MKKLLMITTALMMSGSMTAYAVDEFGARFGGGDVVNALDDGVDGGVFDAEGLNEIDPAAGEETAAEQAEEEQVNVTGETPVEAGVEAEIAPTLEIQTEETPAILDTNFDGQPDIVIDAGAGEEEAKADAEAGVSADTAGETATGEEKDAPVSEDAGQTPAASPEATETTPETVTE